jgi:hypothetical protein
MPSMLQSNTQAIVALGRPLQDFHLHRAWLGRWGYLILAFLGLASSAVVLAFGGYQAYLFYYQFGPAIVWKMVQLPILLEVIFGVIGLAAARAAYVNWMRGATLYENGFTYQDHRGIQIWLWNEIQNYRNIVYRNYAAFLHTSDTHQCLLMKISGSRLILDDDLELVEQLAGKIRENVFPRLYAQAISQFQAGNSLQFGSLVISPVKGIEYHHKSFRLEAIEATNLANGCLRISLKNENKRETLKFPVSKLSNLDILLAILADIKSKNLGSTVPPDLPKNL